MVVDFVNSVSVESLPVELIGLSIAVVLFYGAHKYLGRWPDLWQYRKMLLPKLAMFDDHPHVPNKTKLELQEEEFVGVVDQPPEVVRAHFMDAPSWWSAPLASIQFEMQSVASDDVGSDYYGEDTEQKTKVFEVGSYAHREDGFFGEKQVHVRLTPRDGGRKTALWAHYEYSPWASPKKHYHSVGWDAETGVEFVTDHIESTDELSFEFK